MLNRAKLDLNRAKLVLYRAKQGNFWICPVATGQGLLYRAKTGHNRAPCIIRAVRQVCCERESSGLQREPQNKHGKSFIHMKILKLRRRLKKPNFLLNMSSQIEIDVVKYVLRDVPKYEK